MVAGGSANGDADARCGVGVPRGSSGNRGRPAGAVGASAGAAATGARHPRGATRAAAGRRHRRGQRRGRRATRRHALLLGHADGWRRSRTRAAGCLHGADAPAIGRSGGRRVQQLRSRLPCYVRRLQHPGPGRRWRRQGAGADLLSGARPGVGRVGRAGNGRQYQQLRLVLAGAGTARLSGDLSRACVSHARRRQPAASRGPLSRRRDLRLPGISTRRAVPVHSGDHQGGVAGSGRGRRHRCAVDPQLRHQRRLLSRLDRQR